MDYFCELCASKPGWPWDATKAFQHSCQRCFRNLPCNDYGYRKGHHAKAVVAAPVPKHDLVGANINPQAQVDLPKAKANPPPVPQPVYEVDPPAAYAPPLVAAPLIPQAPDHRNEADKALDAVQPNRPGVKLEKITKDGRKVAPPPEPKFEG